MLQPNHPSANCSAVEDIENRVRKNSFGLSFSKLILFHLSKQDRAISVSSAAHLYSIESIVLSSTV